MSSEEFRKLCRSRKEIEKDGGRKWYQIKEAELFKKCATCGLYVPIEDLTCWRCGSTKFGQQMPVIPI